MAKFSQDGSMRWFALRVVSQKEYRVLAKLTSRGHCAFVPTLLCRKRVGRHGSRLATTPMLPGYVFVGFRKGKRIPWRQVREIDGVHGPVWFAGSPARVLQHEIDGISEYSGALIEPAAAPALRKGGSAKVTTGALAGYVVRITSIAKRKVRAVLDSGIEVEVPVSILAAA